MSRPAHALARLLPVLAVLLGTLPVTGLEVTLPLGGYHRPGRFLPVRVSRPEGSGLTLRATGAVTTSLEGGTAPAIVPFLPLEPLRQVRYAPAVGAGGFVEADWRALGLDQVLVGFVGPVDPSVSQQLFPGRQPIPLPLNRPPEGPATAWNTLDALVLAGPLPEEARLRELWTAGITLVVPGAARPPGELPWTALEGGGWVLRADWLGPRLAGENRPALAAVAGWAARWPAAFRLRIWLLGLLTAVLLCAAWLLPRRWGVPAGIAVAAAVSVGLLVWAAGRPAALARTTTVAVEGAAGQMDRWTFLAAPTPGEVRIAWDGLTLPLLAGPHAGLLELTLGCRPDGTPAEYRLRLPKGVTVAFVARQAGVRSALPTAPADPLAPPARLAQRAYLTTGWGIGGWRPGSGGSIYIEDLGAIWITQ
jgi:hypothetical protein